MILLDIIEPGRPYRGPVRPIREVVKDTIDTVKDSIADVKEAVTDSLAQSQVVFENTTQNEASLLLPIAVVVLALGACLWLAYLYRRRLAVK